MDKSKSKQIIFGLIFLGIIILIIVGIYFLFFNSAPTCFDNKQNGGEVGVDCGGSCMSCDLKYPLAFKVNQLKAFPADNNRIILVAEIKNPNQNYGASDFAYNFSIFDKSNQKIKDVLGHSFVYAGEISRIVNVIDFDYKNFLRSELKFDQPQWVAKNDFIQPNVIVKEFKTDVYNPQEITIPLYTFTRDLSSGIKGEDVTKLQEFLASDKFYTASTTDIFDLKTKNALIKYQKANFLLPATGYFDSETRNFINNKIEAVKRSIAQSAEIYPVTVSGIIKNDGLTSASKIIVNAFIYDKLGVMISASKTEFENLAPINEQPFRIIFSKNIDVLAISPTLTKVYVSSMR